MKFSYKSITIVIIGFIMYVLVSSFFVIFFTKIEKEKDSYERYIGKKMILDKDTLTIINYSIISETFTLSNGQKVTYKLVSKNTLINE